MAYTREQVLAFVEVLLGSPKACVHLGAVLGQGKVPGLEDWTSMDPDAIDRCDDLLDYLTEATGILRECQITRGRQKTIDFQAEAIDLNKTGVAPPREDIIGLDEFVCAACGKTASKKIGCYETAAGPLCLECWEAEADRKDVIEERPARTSGRRKTRGIDVW